MIKALFLAAVLCAATASPLQHKARVTSNTVIPGYVTHGVNNFNNQLQYNFAGVSNTWASFPPVYEIGTLDADPTLPPITDATPGSTPMATTDYNFRQEFFGGAVPAPEPSLLNLRIHDVGVFWGGTTDATLASERASRGAFEDSDRKSVSHSRGTGADVTLDDWNSMSGRVRVKCFSDGTAASTFEVADAIPNGLYTFWDVGVEDPTGADQVIFSPFGGAPNVLVVDGNGDGKLTRRTNYCPTDTCGTGTATTQCTMYMSLFYHFDASVYGSSPVPLSAPGFPVGVYASNQMQFFMQGEPLQEPTTRFPGRGRGRGRGGRGGRGGDSSSEDSSESSSS